MFDHEGRPIQFDTWLDDLQLYLLSDSRDNVSLFDHTSGASLAPPATADSTTHSQWLTCDAPARLAIRNHLVGSAATVRARVARVVEVAAGVVVGATVEVVEVVKVVAAVGVVAGVGALVAAVVAAVGVAVVAAVGVVAVGTCEKPHTQHRCFSHLDNAWRAEFGDEAECSRWEELLRSGVDIFALYYDAILAAMYALSISAEGDRYLYVPPDPGIEAVALGASESALPGIAPPGALHTITLDSRASHCFFRESTTLTPLSAPIPVRLANPSGSPVLARSSNVLLCPAVLSGSLSGLHLPSFSTNLVSTAALRDTMVTTTTPGGQRVSICKCTRTGRHLATFTRRHGSSLYTLATEPPQVAASAKVSASGLVVPPCSCRLLSHQTLLWHHQLGHPSLPRLHGMHSRLLVSGLPRSLPPFPPSPAPPCLPCIEGRQRAAPHSSSFPPTTAPLQTLHMDVKGQVPDVSIPWIRAVLLHLSERFCPDLPVLRLHSDRGGEFSSDLLQDFCHGEGILQLFTLPASPQQNGIAERRIGLVMEVAHTSMIHAAAPHFLWPFAVRYAAHQLNLWPPFVHDTSAEKLFARAILCIFLGFPSDAPSWQFYHPTSRRVLPSQDVTFDELVPFYHPLPGIVPVEVAVDIGAARGPASGGAASGDAEPAGAEPRGAESKGAGSRVAEPGGAELAGVEPRGAESEGAESGGTEPRATASSGGPASALPRMFPRPEPLSLQQLQEWFARRTRLQSGAAGVGDSATKDTGAGGAGVPTGARGPGGAGADGPGGARTRGTGAAGAGGDGGAGAGDPGACGAGAGGTGASGLGGTGAAGAGGAARIGAGGTGGGAARGTGAAGLGGAHPGGTGADRAGGAADVGAGDSGAGGGGPGGAGAVGAGSRDTGRPRPYFVPLLQQPASPLSAPSPYTEQTKGLTQCHEPVSHPASPDRAVRTGRRVPRPRPPSVPGKHHMALRPSSLPHRVPLPSPPATSLVDDPNPESYLVHTTSHTVPRLLATVVTDPSLEGECALGTYILEDRQEDFESFAASIPHLVSLLIAPEGDPDAPDIPTPRSYTLAITGPSSSQWQIAMDAKMASWKSTGTYVDAVPPPRANIVDGMWIFRVKRPPGSPPAFKARYVARGFSQRQGVDFFHNFSPTPKMTTLQVLLHVAAQRDYELHSLDFSTAFLQGSLHEEIWLRRPHGFTGSFPAGSQWSLRRPVYSLRQVPREWHNTLRTTLAALGLSPSTADPSLFLCTDTSLPPFCVLVYVDDLVFATADTEALTFVKSELQKIQPCTDLGELRSYLGLQVTLDRAQHTITLTQSHMVHQEAAKRVLRYLCRTSGMGLELGGQGPVVLTGHADAFWVDDLATHRLSHGYTFSLSSGSVSWQSTRSSSVLSSICEAEIYAGAMAVQELRWLTYLLSDLGERPRSSPVLYADNKAMIALCQEHRLEHRTKHIALHYFLAQNLQQRGHLCLAYVATRANTIDIFTKALQSGDHQRAAIPHSTVHASSTRFRRPVSTSPRSSASPGHGVPASSVRAESGASSTTASAAAAGFSTDSGGRGSGVSAATPAQSAPAGSAHGPSGGATSGDRAARIAGEELAEECDEAVEDLGEVRARVRATREAVSKGRGVVRASLLLVLAVLSRTWQLLLAVPRGISSVARMSAADWSGTFKGWWKAIKHGAHHYWVGSKLLWADIRISSRLMLKAANGKALTRRERQQLTRTSADIFRLVPFAVFVIVPFLEFLLPLALRLFPNMLPSTFQDKNKEEEKLKRRLQARLEMARFLQGTVGEMAKEVKSRRSGEVKRTAEELQKFMKKVNTGGRVTNEEIVAFASLFNDELTLDNMSRPRLVSMCKYMGLQTFGTDAYLRYILRAKLAWIKEDDKMIQSEGVESLSEGELRAACRERGMLGLRSVDDMRKQLRDWLDLALNRSVPSSLLILSRAFLVGSKRPEEAVQATLSSLPAEVVRSVGATVPSDDEAETSARLRKLKLIKEQERLIEEEAQEAARLQLAGGRDLAREEMREALPTPAAATTTTTTPAGAAAAAAPAAGVVGAGAGGAAVEGVAVEGEEARALAERKALAKKDQLCDLSAALAVLASSSSVAKERADFLRLVNKEIELYNSMVQQHGTEGAEELRVAYAAAREASEKEASEAAASDVSDALISKVDSMLHKLEKELDSADAKIGKRLKTLDTSSGVSAVQTSLLPSHVSQPEAEGSHGGLIAATALPAHCQHGKILVEDIVKLGAHAQVSMDRDDDMVSGEQGGIKGSTGSSSGTGSSVSGK
ncbi:unnamed protein product [Closterium sp. NIES-53]